MIEIYSRKLTDQATPPAKPTVKWERPENITIKNCNVIGSIHVWGMGRYHSDTDILLSSRLPDFTTIARNNAPRKVTLDRVNITAAGKIPLYIHPGVTNFQLVDSRMGGKSDSVAIYLDAESSGNTFRNNYIEVKTGREVVAIDGSSYNKIVNNEFRELSDGGIYLYRNCGEDGGIRHSTPSHNTIVNNIFYYDKYIGGNPSVYLGSRDGRTRKGNTGDCREDDGWPYGSSASDLDYARYNVVMQNQIYKRSIGDMIRSKNWENNSPNYIGYNETVNTELKSLAGCYVSANGYQRDFILHGESADVLEIRNGEPTCNKYTCTDGDLSHSNQPSCKVSKSGFDCQVSHNNGGCQKTVYCPSGQRIIGATAACNLEYGPVSDAILGVPTNTIRVIRASDRVSDGSCSVGGNSVQSGEKTISGIDGLDRVQVGCKEHDENGGDCHITGILYCR